MFCPNPSCHQSSDQPQLLLTERSGIEIDYCPKCRGIWLDRGELDKLLDRAQADTAAPAPTINQHAMRDNSSERYREPERDHRPAGSDYHHNKHSGHYGKSRKKSFLSEIFDF